MKALLALFVGMAMATFAWADPQIDMDNDNSCHFPLAHWFAGEELNIDTGECDSSIAELHNEGQGYCYCTLEQVPEFLLEYAYWTAQKVTKDGLVRILKITSKDMPYTACHLDADNGSNYDSYKWRSKIVYNEENGTAKADLECEDGVRK